MFNERYHVPLHEKGHTIDLLPQNVCFELFFKDWNLIRPGSFSSYPATRGMCRRAG